MVSFQNILTPQTRKFTLPKLKAIIIIEVNEYNLPHTNRQGKTVTKIKKLYKLGVGI